MDRYERATDEELLTSSLREPEAFGAFYRRHARPLAGYFLQRTGSAELAADLTAETFAAALHARRRYRPAKGPAVAWLYGIARHKLLNALHRGRVEDRARRRVGIPPIVLDEDALERVAALACGGDGHVVELLDALPPEQRDAVRARVLNGREYRDIAAAAQTSEAVIRKRVSRGLAGLRAHLERERTP